MARYVETLLQSVGSYGALYVISHKQLGLLSMRALWVQVHFRAVIVTTPPIWVFTGSGGVTLR